MFRGRSLSGRPRLLVHSLAVLGASLGLLTATTGSASAAPVRLDYPLSGTSTIKSTNSSLTLGPGTLRADADLTAGTLTAETDLPASKGSFKAIGFLPVSVTVEFLETEPTRGTLDLKTGAVQATTKLTLRLKDLKVGGIPTPVGSQCETETPAVLDLTSEPGFNPLTGGTLTTTYTIPKFHNCLLSTGMINLVIPGGGNTATLTLGAATAPPAQ